MTKHPGGRPTAKGYIYTLSDDTGVRYVGQSCNPKRRYNAHCSILHNSRGSHLNRWLLSLLKSGAKPKMDIVLETSSPDQDEIRLVQEYRQKGFNLVNTSAGGKDTRYIHTRKDVPWSGRHTPLQTILLNFRQTIKLHRKHGKEDVAKKIEGYIDYAQSLVALLGKDEINIRLWNKYHG